MPRNWQSFTGISVLVFLISDPAWPLVDWIHDEARELGAVAAYADAMDELIQEVHPNSEAQQFLSKLEKDARRFESKLRDLGYTGESLNLLSQGPRWDTENVLASIQRTSSYIKRLRRFLAKATALGTSGLTALGVIETNSSLNSMEKNQQALMVMQMKENEYVRRKHVSEIVEEKKWDSFIQRQRSRRQKEGFWP